MCRKRNKNYLKTGKKKKKKNLTVPEVSGGPYCDSDVRSKAEAYEAKLIFIC